MSASQPTYEDLVGQVGNLKVLLAEVKDEMKDKKEAMDDDDDKNTKDAFKQAKRAMKDEDKEHKAMSDDKEKVKDAFKIAEDEEDPDKKKDAMKKAMDEKDDYDKKHAKKAMDEPDPKTEKKDPERDAKIASLENKYREPLIEKIYQATQIVDPANAEIRLKQLNAASLTQLEDEWTKLKPFTAGFMPETVSATRQGMIPFQASITADNLDIHTASANDIDFANIPTEKIMEMYT